MEPNVAAARLGALGAGSPSIASGGAGKRTTRSSARELTTAEDRLVHGRFL
jgi:hypothetical protein